MPTLDDASLPITAQEELQLRRVYDLLCDYGAKCVAASLKARIVRICDEGRELSGAIS